MTISVTYTVKKLVGLRTWQFWSIVVIAADCEEDVFAAADRDGSLWHDEVHPWRQKVAWSTLGPTQWRSSPKLTPTTLSVIIRWQTQAGIWTRIVASPIKINSNSLFQNGFLSIQQFPTKHVVTGNGNFIIKTKSCNKINARLPNRTYHQKRSFQLEALSIRCDSRRHFVTTTFGLFVGSPTDLIRAERVGRRCAWPSPRRACRPACRPTTGCRDNPSRRTWGATRARPSGRAAATCSCWSRCRSCPPSRCRRRRRRRRRTSPPPPRCCSQTTRRRCSAPSGGRSSASGPAAAPTSGLQQITRLAGNAPRHKPTTKLLN